ncbi:hypothetical protein JR316_0001261 [Psilocybe cubensis]|uniref:Uncharacterized protein n=2 Tax=Psilocybe cubensis TaxID=181762 RepID=A0ACB8HHP6_PSICU|nr:hypothetical protein JR316_0001261 [Psilocybe cubensis]KAH9487192.1 hypothetical protein JR316_0001261 [Psilocybe cubensis]
MANPPLPYDGFMTMSLEDRFTFLFRAQQVQFDANKKIDDRLSAIEKEHLAALTSTPTTGPPHTQSICSTTTKAALEKIVATLSIADKQAGHIIGHAGTSLHQIHDILHAKISVSPVVTSGLRAVTIRDTACEVGNALSAIGKRIAHCCICNPRSKKPKQPPAPTAAPLTLVIEPPSPTPISSSTYPNYPSLSLASGLPMEVDALRAPQQHSDGYSYPGPVQPRKGIQIAHCGGGPSRVFGANRPW